MAMHSADRRAPGAGARGRARRVTSVSPRSAEALLAGAADALVQVLIDKALQGDMTAMRLCLERVYPLERDRAVPVALPPLEGASDVRRATLAVLEAMSQGRITPREAAEFTKVIEAHTRAIAMANLDERIACLEDKGR